ncbi:MAG: GHKL domain-containing protein, partial [Gammaproteobacteria bacterium]|nr:GHKL domain-containing protein [Gammaproteobacteria bacterium]
RKKRNQRSTNTIIHQVEAMKEMVQAFSEYARPPALHLQSVDLNALIREGVELYRGESAQRKFTLELADDLVPIEADAGRLRQLLNNLLQNALEATQGQVDCNIQVRTRNGEDRYAGMLELHVQDNGPGLDEAVIEQLFEPYVTTKPRGSGLGLAIVKKIIEEHNGMIAARNTEPGALITVRLPLRIKR